MRKVGLIAAAALVVALPLATLSASAQTRGGGGMAAVEVAPRGAAWRRDRRWSGLRRWRYARRPRRRRPGRADWPPAPSVAAPSVVDLWSEAARSPPVRASASDRRRTGADVQAGAAVPGWNGGWRHHHGRRFIGPGIGFGTGLALGAYAASPYYYGYDEPYYYDSYPYDEGVVVGGTAGSPEDVAYCQRRYRSYDVNSGTFLGNDGQRHPCP